MIVIYAEKYSLAKAIAESIGYDRVVKHPEIPSLAHFEIDSFKGTNAVICHGAGHLCGLAPPKAYNDSLAKWDMDSYPFIPQEYILTVKDNSFAKTAYNYCVNFFEQADYIINACDADREGELIFTYIYELSGCTKPFYRLWVSDLTDWKVREAFDNLRTAEDMKSLIDAAKVRGRLDWLIGMNLTVLSTLKFGNSANIINVGRVKTPTLALVVRRQREIDSYVKKPVYRIQAVINTDNSSFKAVMLKDFETTDEALEYISKIDISGGARVLEAQYKQKKIPPPLLYNTTHLQSDLSKKLTASLDTIAEILQSLYLSKLITYPRTSSEHLTTAMSDDMQKIIKALMEMPEFAEYKTDTFEPVSKRHYDDTKVDSHAALTPTLLVPNNLNGMSQNEQTAYKLIALSCIRTVYPDAVTEKIKYKLDIDGNSFVASGTNIIQNGWYAVDAMPDFTPIEKLDEGSVLKDLKLQIIEVVNEPPRAYTDASLLLAMELAGNKIEDENVRNLMKLQKRGLGTAATRESIISDLYKNGYITHKSQKNSKEQKTIAPTPKGVAVIDILEKAVPVLLKADYTGEIEMQLNGIITGEQSSKEFMKQAEKLVLEMAQDIKGCGGGAIPTINLKCPLCGTENVVKTKSGWGCTGYKNGCEFYIKNEILGVKITEALLRELIVNRKTKLIKGFKTKEGRQFDAHLVLDDNQKVEFAFPEREILTCPICGKPVYKSDKGWYCSGRKDDTCSFFIARVICGKTITDTAVKLLVTNGRTAVIKGFTSKTGKKFDAVLKIDNGKIVFDY